MTRNDFLVSITAALGARGGAATSVKEFEPKGKLFVIEIPHRFRTQEQFDEVQTMLQRRANEFGCKFMLLEGGATMRDPSAPIVNISIPSEITDAQIAEIARRLRASGVAI